MVDGLLKCRGPVSKTDIISIRLKTVPWSHLAPCKLHTLPVVGADRACEIQELPALATPTEAVKVGRRPKRVYTSNLQAFGHRRTPQRSSPLPLFEAANPSPRLESPCPCPSPFFGHKMCLQTLKPKGRDTHKSLTSRKVRVIGGP